MRAPPNFLLHQHLRVCLVTYNAFYYLKYIASSYLPNRAIVNTCLVFSLPPRSKMGSITRSKKTRPPSSKVNTLNEAIVKAVTRRRSLKVLKKKVAKALKPPVQQKTVSFEGILPSTPSPLLSPPAPTIVQIPSSPPPLSLPEYTIEIDYVLRVNEKRSNVDIR